MLITIEGTVRTRSRSGKGFFRVTKWQEGQFKVELRSSGSDPSAKNTFSHQLSFKLDRQSGKSFVGAEVKGKSFILGEVGEDKAKLFRFSVLSVAGIEVSGVVNVVSTN